MLRGGGIVASRVLQRLMDDRAKYGLSTEIVHLFRTYIAGPHGPNAWNRRQGGNGFAYQGFNYPKSVWGGQLKAEMRKLEGDAARGEVQADGRHQHAVPPALASADEARAGTAAGTARWQARSSEMRLEQRQDRQLRQDPATACVEVAADFVIDCTGLEADIAEHRVLADLLEHSGAGRNPLGRLDVERSFELRGAAQRPGRDVRLGRDHARRLLPRRGHVPRAAGRCPGDRRRPGPPRILRQDRAIPLDSAVAALGTEQAAVGPAVCR